MLQRSRAIIITLYSCVALQAVWRGYTVRRRLAFALSFAKFHDSDESADEFEEIDIGAFDLNPVTSLLRQRIAELSDS